MRAGLRGLSVMETMVAVTVFLVAVMALIGVYPASVRASRLAHGHLLANNVAEKELEFSRAMEYDAIENRDNAYALVLESNGAETTLDLQTHMEVTEVREGLKRLELQVKWKGLDSSTRTTRMETYVARLTP